jgi:UMF1 family MFS transporter
MTDYFGPCKPWIFLSTLICAVATALLYFGEPLGSSANILFVLAMVVVANTAQEVALVFNNAMLPHIAPASKLGRISGWAWSMGYAGGIVCLVIALVFLVGIGHGKPILGLPTENAENVRAVTVLVALWMMVFMIPMMLYTKDSKRTSLPFGQAIRQGLGQLRETLRTVRSHKNILRFLVASAIYRDGLNTLFAMGGLYAAGTFGMTLDEILLFAIGLNVTAGFGAAGFAYMDDLKGSKQTVVLSLVGLLLSGLAVLLVQDKAIFIGLAMIMGLFIGPVQSASRTMAARLSAPEHFGQTYGLYSLTGRVAAVFGPLTYAYAVYEFDSLRAGMATILLFWLVGMMILFTVRDNERDI